MGRVGGWLLVGRNFKTRVFGAEFTNLIIHRRQSCVTLCPCTGFRTYKTWELSHEMVGNAFPVTVPDCLHLGDF